jgi:hypothetical protein
MGLGDLRGNSSKSGHYLFHTSIQFSSLFVQSLKEPIKRIGIVIVIVEEFFDICRVFFLILLHLGQATFFGETMKNVVMRVNRVSCGEAMTTKMMYAYSDQGSP